MGHKKVRAPGGTLNGSGGKRSESAGIGKKLFFIWVGILIGCILSQPIQSEAKGLNQVIDDDGIPDEYEIIFEEVGEMYDICPELLEAIAYKESRFTPDAVNGNHYGMMQVNVKIHADRIAKFGYVAEDMFTPYPNILVAADYLAELFETYGDDDPLVLLYYSGSSKSISQYKEYGFLTKYVSSVLARSERYERIHGK